MTWKVLGPIAAGLLCREAASPCRRTARDWVVVNAVDVVARLVAAATRTRRKVVILFNMVMVGVCWSRNIVKVEVRTRYVICFDVVGVVGCISRHHTLSRQTLEGSFRYRRTR